MRRVVVTGLGIVSSIGNTIGDVTRALYQGDSGNILLPEMADLGYRCHVYAPVKAWDATRFSKQVAQTTSTGAQYALGAALDALADAGLSAPEVQNDRTAIVVGSAFGSLSEASRAERQLSSRRSPSRLGGTGVVKMLNSSAAGNIAAHLGVQGRVYSISSAFSTGTDALGHAFDLVRWGLQDVAICGAAEEDIWRQAGVSLEASRAMPADFDERPAAACRPFDRDRQGLVLSEGAGVLILESLDGARRRGAPVYAEVVGYGSANDGGDMFRPSGDGLRQALRSALQDVDSLDYVNCHAGGSVVGDPVECEALCQEIGDGPWVSSTKGQTGHGMGAAGAQEAVYTLLMLKHHFVAPTANLDTVDPRCTGVRHARTRIDTPLTTAASISIGLGGTNACIAFRQLETAA